MTDMNRLITIPRDALAELLQTAGSPLTPEEFVASLAVPETNAKYPSRAKASAISKRVLLLAAVLSVLWIPFSFDVENVILGIGLCVVTFFEYRVNAFFREGNPAAPALGFKNQACFAGAILIYGLYHAFLAPKMQVPPEYHEMIDSATLAMVQSVMQVGYLAIGIVGGVSQFWLAWYYRSANEL